MALRNLAFIIYLLFCCNHLHAQQRDANKTKQIEQLQHLQLTVIQKIDTLHFQMSAQAANLEDTRKRLDQIRKETNGHDKPEPEQRQLATQVSQELVSLTNEINTLQKKLTLQLKTLDKAVTLEKDLEDKIADLIRESSQ